MIRKSMLCILAMLCVSTVTLADTCQPLYWEVNRNFTLQTNEVKDYAALPIHVKNITRNVTQELIQVQYSLSDTVIKQNYDGGKINTTWNNNDTFVINNIIINLAFTFNATSIIVSKIETNNTVPPIKGYNGTGSGTIDKVIISFSKKIISNQGTARFELVKVNIVVPAEVNNIKFNPQITNKNDNNTFRDMVSNDLHDEIMNTLSVSLKGYLHQIIAKESFPNPFGVDKYNYTFISNSSTISIIFSLHMSNVTLLKEGGVIIGYDMLIEGGDAVCSQFIPNDTSKQYSYITVDLIQSLYRYVSSNNPDWKGKRLDSSNTKSDVFQFYMIDLEEIIPDALTKYPSLLTKTEAQCSLANQGMLNIDATYKLIKVSAVWNCDLYIYNTSIKLISTYLINVDVQPSINYEVKLTQSGDKLQATVSNVYMTGANFNPMPEFPINNERLANLYIKSIVSSMGSFTTLGTGFRQPLRNTPVFEWYDDHIRIWDSSRKSLRID